MTTSHHGLVLDMVDLEIIDALAPWLLVIMIVLAPSNRRARGTDRLRSGGQSRVPADDPYFFPIGEAPVLPHQLISAGPSWRNENGGSAENGIPRSSGTSAVLTSSKGARHV